MSARSTAALTIPITVVGGETVIDGTALRAMAEAFPHSTVTRARLAGVNGCSVRPDAVDDGKSNR